MLSKKILSHTSSSSSAMRQHPLSSCGDCGAPGPLWASINRGILLCSDCCSVHRSLGRHVSQIKCAKAGSGAVWVPEQLTMVQSLFSCGANSIWEYSLLNPAENESASSSSLPSKSAEFGKMRKPRASDPLHPQKSDFIRAKHLHQAFVFRPAGKEETSETELSRQLHGAVRTHNLETSLRLLSQGASPNYSHPEKNGSTPLHIACKSGQAGQAELLLVYGSDPGAVDNNGRTPSDYAKTAGFHAIAQRVSHSLYEVSDRLAFFLCQRRPDHNSGQHFLVPDLNKPSDDAKIAKRKLQMLSNHVFEELTVDVYDEVDRRETDAIWNALHGSKVNAMSSPSSACLPFLPVNPDYGTSRNQARQKLARLDKNEFAALVTDVLKEIRRRTLELGGYGGGKGGQQRSPLRENPSLLRGPQHKSLPASMANNRLIGSTAGSDDEPIYDHVASDDDYYNIPDTPSDEIGSLAITKLNSTLPRLRTSALTTTTTAGAINSLQSSPAKSTSSGNSGSKRSQDQQQQQPGSIIISHSSEYFALKQQLENSEHRVQALIDSNDDMRNEVYRLSTMVNKLVNENHVLRNSGRAASPVVAVATAANSSTTSNNPVENDYATPHPVVSSTKPLPPVRSTTTTMTMFDQQQRQSSGPNSLPVYMSPAPPVSSSPSTASSNHPYYNQPSSGSSFGHQLPPSYEEAEKSSSSLPLTSDFFTSSSGGGGLGLGGSSSGGGLGLNNSCSGNALNGLPSQEEVVRRTEAITRCIQELLVSAKDEKFDAFIPCSERIVRAVTDMVSLFPEWEDSDEEAPWGRSPLGLALADLMAAAHHFETECRILIARSQKEPLHQGFVTQQVIQCAFDIAKSTKQLVAMFQ